MFNMLCFSEQTCTHVNPLYITPLKYTKISFRFIEYHGNKHQQLPHFTASQHCWSGRLIMGFSESGVLQKFMVNQCWSFSAKWAMYLVKPNLDSTKCGEPSNEPGPFYVLRWYWICVYIYLLLLLYQTFFPGVYHINEVSASLPMPHMLSQKIIKLKDSLCVWCVLDGFPVV